MSHLVEKYGTYTQMAKYFATTSVGIEDTLCKELEALGASEIVPARGGVYFEGDKELLYRANLWLRTATRILMPVREFSAVTPVMLYDQVRRMKWETYLDTEKTLAVDCTIAGVKRRDDRGLTQEERESRYENQMRKNDEARRVPGTMLKAGWQKQGLTHSHYVALKIKDAVVDRLREKFGSRPNVNTEHPDLKIHAFVKDNKCTISFDSSGRSLHERGYRKVESEAPMKENLAAALVLMSEWDRKSPFIDPMCGSGTLAIEAAMIAANIAPGLLRTNFGFMGWADFDAGLWKRLVKEAEDKIDQDCKTKIFAFDLSQKMTEAAEINATRAGVEDFISFRNTRVEDLKAPTEQPGVILVNPPYGERIGKLEEMKPFYKSVGDIFKQRMKGWSAFVFTGNLEAAKFVGLRTSRKVPLFNGAIECRLLKYDLY